MFGTNNSKFGTGGFGSSANAFKGPLSGNNAFGNLPGTGFGTPSGSLFSSTNTPGSNVFGSGGTSNPFGSGSTSFNFGGNTQPNAGGLFSTPTSTTFGAKTGTFGAPTSGGSLFGGGGGQQAGLFGSTSSNQMTGGFGSTATGTTVKFVPETAQDSIPKGGTNQQINVRYQTLTVMKAYKTKSIEELRVEDYAANRKGSSNVGGSGLFGSSNNNNAMQSSFTFNQPKTTTSGFGGFNAQPSTASSLFGQSNTGLGAFSGSKPLFGSTTATTAGNMNTFGTSQTSSLFGNNQTRPLFGGATSQPPSGLFGNIQPTNLGFQANSAGSAGFGMPLQGGNMFAGNKPAFGTTTNSTSGSTLFGAQPTTGGLFGQAKPAMTQSTFGTTPSFGVQTTTAGLFGKPSFNTSSTMGSFGAGLGTGGSLFGNAAKSNPGLFNTGQVGLGMGGLSSMAGTGLPGGAVTNLATGSELAAQEQQLQLQLMMLTQSPYGDSPLFKNLKVDSERRQESLKPTNPTAQKVALQTTNYKVSPKPMTKIKPKPIRGPNTSKNDLFDGLEDDDMFTKGMFVPRSSIKKLVIKKKSANNTYDGSTGLDTSRIRSYSPDGLNQSEILCGGRDLFKSSNSPASPESRSPVNNTIRDLNIAGKGKSPVENFPRNGHFSPEATQSPHDRRGFEISFNESLARPEPDPEPEMQGKASLISEDYVLNAAGVVQSRCDYFTVPSLEELDEFVDQNGRCLVENFVVGREGYGTVFFPGIVDITGMNLDEIVQFRRNEITIYPDDKQRPPLGKGLNRPAQVSLDCVWPKDKSTHQPIKDVERLHSMGFLKRIERATAKNGATFKEFRADTGTWVFEVQHFSKYGLIDDSDEDNEPTEEVKKALLKSKKVKATEKPLNPELQEKSTENLSVEKPKSLEVSGRDDQRAKPSFGRGAGLGGINYFDEDLPLDSRCNKSSLFSHLDDSGRHNEPSDKELIVQEELLDELEKDEARRYPAMHAMQADSAKVQQMKASLFMNNYMEKEKDKSLPLIKNLLIHPAGDSAMDYSITEPIGLKPEDDLLSFLAPEPSTAGSQLVQQFVSYENSLLYDREHCIADLGLFKSRSYRVGWGPNNCFTVLGCASNEAADQSILLSDSRPSNSSGCVTVYRFNSAPCDDNSYKCLLEAELSQTQSDSTEQCVSLSPNFGTELLHEMRNCQKASPLWSLCFALWSPDTVLQEDGYLGQKSRLVAVSDWLVENVEEEVAKELRVQKTDDAPPVHSLLSHLSGFSLVEACQLARETGHHQLALLMSQAAGNSYVREMLMHQLVLWREEEAEDLIDPIYLQVYGIMAGILDWGSSGHICTGMSWLRAFAMHLWYESPQTACLSDVLLSFSESWESGKVSPPLAHFSKVDVYYQLMKLHTDRTYPLNKLLTPNTYSAAHLDYSHSWHLWLLLNSLGYNHLADAHVGHISVNYAAQLEAEGLWEWSAFVLLHIPEEKSRSSAICSLLHRNMTIDASCFLLSKLDIPGSWIHEAKALQARNSGDAELLAVNLIKANCFNRAHQVILEELAPFAIINDMLDDLKIVLRELTRHEMVISDWQSGGRVYLDYIVMVQTLDQIKNENLAVAELERLQPDVVNLCERLSFIACPTVAHRLAQSEMATRAASMLRTLLMLQNHSLPSCKMLAPHLTNLPMPNDCALQELKSLTSAYMLSIT